LNLKRLYGAPLLTKDTLQQARTYFESFAVAVEPEKWTEINRSFHCCLYEAGQSPNFLKVINSLLDRMDRYLRAQLSLTDGMARATEEHEAILKACEAGDADLAAKWTYEHIQGVKASLLCYLNSKKEKS
jgi:DNA-binding GntR family transcriptional regulator|tara:strand:- start:531 stop:920 length:390 start_codon:yes stop_codon:yes gene_type:complete